MPLPPIGFPAHPRHDLMGRLIADLRSRSDTAREEAVTGRHADPASALGGKVAELLDLERALRLNQQYREIIVFAESRATAVQGSLDALRNLAIDLAAEGQTALDSNLATVGETASAAARQALDAAVAALNSSYAGRGLFSGDSASGPALTNGATIAAETTAILEAVPTSGMGYADLTVAFESAGGLFDTDFYTGGSGDAPSSEIAEGERLAFAPRADDPAFRALLRDIAALAAAFDPANAVAPDQRRAVAAQAVAGLRNDVGALAGIAGRVGTAEARMAEVRARHEANQTALTQAYNGLAGRDQFEAAAELTALEAQLQTTYLTTARLANLSLANFLR